jgi:hypothetical protein
MWRLIYTIALALVTFSYSAPANVLDWSTVTWPPGSLSNTYPDPSSPGSSVSITMSGNTSTFNGGSPSIVNDNLGGTGKPSLQLNTSNLFPSSFVTVTINFNAYPNGVYVQNLNILDVDFSPGIIGLVAGWQDQIRNISALTVTGQTVNPVAVAGGSAVTITGNQITGWTATGSARAGTGSSAGNVSLDFGNYRVTRITFSFGSGPGAPLLLASQVIGLDNITFLLTPEKFPGAVAMMLCGLVLVVRTLFPLIRLRLNLSKEVTRIEP